MFFPIHVTQRWRQSFALPERIVSQGASSNNFQFLVWSFQVIRLSLVTISRCHVFPISSSKSLYFLILFNPFPEIIRLEITLLSINQQNPLFLYITTKSGLFALIVMSIDPESLKESLQFPFLSYSLRLLIIPSVSSFEMLTYYPF